MTTLLVLMLVALGAGAALTRSRTERPRPMHGESQIHRCDFCREAILAVDQEARCFVRHAGRRPLFGYSVVNACGACARDHNLDGAFSPESADPST